jgi:hypothetical protein
MALRSGFSVQPRAIANHSERRGGAGRPEPAMVDWLAYGLWILFVGIVFLIHRLGRSGGGTEPDGSPRVPNVGQTSARRGARAEPGPTSERTEEEKRELYRFP